MFLDHTQRRSTVGRTPLDEWSAGKWSAAACLLRSWVRIPPGAWIFVCCECCVLSGRGLCDELITRPGEFYRLWCVVVCDLETSRIGAPCIYIYIYIYDISSLRINDLTLILLTWRKWWAPDNASKLQMGFNSAFKGLIFNNCTLCRHCIHVFGIYLRTNSDLCHLQHKLIGFYNRDENCLQRGTDWVFN